IELMGPGPPWAVQRLLPGRGQRHVVPRGAVDRMIDGAVDRREVGTFLDPLAGGIGVEEHDVVRVYEVYREIPGLPLLVEGLAASAQPADGGRGSERVELVAAAVMPDQVADADEVGEAVLVHQVHEGLGDFPFLVLVLHGAVEVPLSLIGGVVAEGAKYLADRADAGRQVGLPREARVVEHARVLDMLAGIDHRARRCADAARDRVVREGHAGALQPLTPRKGDGPTVEVALLIGKEVALLIGKNEQDVQSRRQCARQRLGGGRQLRAWLPLHLASGGASHGVRDAGWSQEARSGNTRPDDAGRLQKLSAVELNHSAALLVPPHQPSGAEFRSAYASARRVACRKMRYFCSMSRASMDRRRLLRDATLVAIGMLGLAACAPPTVPQRDPASQSVAPSAPAAQSAALAEPLPASRAMVRTGVFGATAEAGIYLALERGYFEEQGLTVELVNVNSGVETIQSLAAGQLDVATGGVTAAFFNALARGVPIKMVVTADTQGPTASTAFLMVRADLLDSGEIADYADLRGRTLAVPARGAYAQYGADLALRRGGLGLQDVEWAELPMGDMNAAFAGHAIDAAVQVEPFATLAAERGLANKWRGFGEIRSGLEGGAVFYGPGLTEEQPELGQRWMTAYLQGVRAYGAALRNGERDAVAAVLARY